MSYGLYDFTETLKVTRRDTGKLARTDVARVLAAWGHGEGMGEDAGHVRFDADKGASEWNGGFLCALKDGRFAYVCGWNDYTGWG